MKWCVVTLFPHSTSKLAWIPTTWNHHVFLHKTMLLNNFFLNCKKLWLIFWVIGCKPKKELNITTKFENFYNYKTRKLVSSPTHTHIYTWWTSSCWNHFPMSNKPTKWCTLTKLNFKVIRQEAYKYIYCDTLYSSTLKHLSAK